MALRKSQLHASLWQSCDQFHGGMDASQYKDYVLTLLFMKYVSDKYSRADDEFSESRVPPDGGFAETHDEFRRFEYGIAPAKNGDGLPANLFHGTGIPACIVVIDKADAATQQLLTGTIRLPIPDAVAANEPGL